jgi:hypothetical protein
MEDKLCIGFQEAVSEYLVRHRSILDIMTKFQEASSRVNRAVAKSATSCGCIEVQGKKQEIPADISYTEIKEYVAPQVKGGLCPHCKEILEHEMGSVLFYLAALCETLGIPLSDAMEKELGKLKTLGIFNLS